MEAVFVYRYEEEVSEGLFAVPNILIGYDYDLASIKDVEAESEGESWGEMIIVREGVFFYNGFDKRYMKLAELLAYSKKIFMCMPIEEDRIVRRESKAILNNKYGKQRP